MARFPYKPGAGAKGMKGPIYWNRLYLQETGVRRRVSQARKSKPKPKRSEYSKPHTNARKKTLIRFMNINANLNFIICAWLYPLTEFTETIDEREAKQLTEKLDAALRQRDYLFDNLGELTQREADKFVTRVKKLFLFIVKLARRYWDDSKEDSVPIRCDYDATEKEFILGYENGKTIRRYFMGQPDVDQDDEIIERFERSHKMVAEWTERMSSPSKNANRAEKKAIRKNKAGADEKARKRINKCKRSSRAKGVVEELTDSGAVRFQYADCVQREAAVRRRLRLHLRVAFQPHTTEGVFANLDDIIETMISGALELDEGGSLQVPIKHKDRTLVIFEFER